ncbi:hypothetical protein HPB47_007286 [Ixodes persulcatus]|uniref:Uncharacterized protein n=1 Tax=Ixodes persulcatus TaxID=34615 RepID=A0AC60P8C8_IXOPE|nr:hypothetical protein HPB47_007286 [Ixodes persulcatus]
MDMVRIGNPNLRIINTRRMGRSQAILVTLGTERAPDYFVYRSMITKFYIYRERKQACTACRQVGYRADACPKGPSKLCPNCGEEHEIEQAEPSMDDKEGTTEGYAAAVNRNKESNTNQKKIHSALRKPEPVTTPKRGTNGERDERPTVVEESTCSQQVEIAEPAVDTEEENKRRKLRRIEPTTEEKILKEALSDMAENLTDFSHQVEDHTDRVPEVFTEVAQIAISNPTIILGDFNAYSTIWGYRTDSKKGKAINKQVTLKDMVLLNDVTNPTRMGEDNPDIDHPIDESEVRAAMQNLRPNSAPGADKVSNKALRNLDDESVTAITEYFNEIWETGERVELQYGQVLPPKWDISKEWLKRIVIKPVPRNMDPRHNDGRREAQTQALNKIHNGDPTVYHTDASPYPGQPKKYVITAFNLEHSHVASVAAHNIDEAEEAVVALSMIAKAKTANDTTITTDSRTATVNYLRCRIGTPARKLLSSFISPTGDSKLKVIWVPAHSSHSGNEAAHSMASRALSNRDDVATGWTGSGEHNYAAPPSEYFNTSFSKATIAYRDKEEHSQPHTRSSTTNKHAHGED